MVRRSRSEALGKAQIGAALPQGVVTRDGKGEAVTGTVLMLVGQNSRDVVHSVKAKIEQLRQEAARAARASRPCTTARASSIARSRRWARNLAEGAAARGRGDPASSCAPGAPACLVTLGIPVAMLIALFGMLQLGVTGSLMSLGAIDFGLFVDGPIVMAEARHRAARDQQRARRRTGSS